MRWMKRLAAGVLAAGMALALLTACGSSKNNSVAPPVPITPPKTEAPNETITGHNVGGQYRYLQYRVVGTSGMGELKYVVTNGSDGSTYVGSDDKGVIISRWSRETDYRVDNKARTIEGSDPSARTFDESALHFFLIIMVIFRIQRNSNATVLSTTEKNTWQKKLELGTVTSISSTTNLRHLRHQPI